MSADELTRTISVSGQGEAAAPPDMATIQTGVVTSAPNASDALSNNNETMERIMALLKQRGIAEKDIQTSSFSVRPEYQRGTRGQKQNEIIGYQVMNQVRVHVRNLPSLGKVLDALVGAGSNQVSGIGFGIEDMTSMLNQARRKAVADARSRADLYALAAGVQIGKVLSISEQSTPLPRPQYMARSFGVEAASAVPVATGEQSIQATVHMVFELKEGSAGK